MSGKEYKYPYGVIWLSHSSLTDFEKCPRLYYLKNVYRNPVTRRRVQAASPYLSLGMSVHRTIEEISVLSKNHRFKEPLLEIFESKWEDYSGKLGGFTSELQEQEYKERGMEMIKRVEENPGSLQNLALKIKEKIPSFMISEEDLLVLCGVVDWIEVLEDGSMHIIDFKTGRNEEKGSQQLQIYKLIAQRYFDRKIRKLSYWYLQKYDEPTEVDVYDSENLVGNIIDRGRKIKELRSKQGVVCSFGGCRNCEKYEMIATGGAEYVGVDKVMDRDMFLIG